TLSVATTASATAGSSTVTITGTSGALVHSATTSLIVSTASAGRTISIDFVGNGVAMAATESAGVVPATNWNSAIGALRATALPLVDQTGVATAASVTWSCNNTWATPVTDLAGSRRMMKGYLDTDETTVTRVTVIGLPVAPYDVYVYVDGD